MSNGIGERVRALRTARGIGQTELATAVGVSKSYLSHIEAGRRPASAALLHQLAGALEVGVDQLESGTPADANEDLQLRLSFAEMSLRNGEWDLALTEYAAIAERARALPLQRHLDEAVFGMARAQAATGALEQAIVVYEQLLDQPHLSAAIPRELVAGKLTMAYAECGDLGRAVDVGEAAIAAMEASHPPPDVSDEVELVSTVAGCYLERGDLTRAQMLIQRALDRAAAVGAPRARAAAAWNAAMISQARHDSRGARRYADRAEALYAEIDDTRRRAMLRIVSAHVQLRGPEPEPADALAQVEAAIEELRDVGTRLDLGYAYTEIARAHLMSGDLAAAGESGRQALRDLANGDRLQTGHVLLVLGRVAMAERDDALAVALYRQAAEALADSGASRQSGSVWRELGEAYIELGRPEEAIEALRRASDSAGATYNPLRTDARVS
jgi:transcriptional regulator with XRE-family HTH domain